MRGNGDPVGKADVMKMRQESHTHVATSPMWGVRSCHTSLCSYHTPVVGWLLIAVA